jgi:hypothetical protein
MPPRGLTVEFSRQPIRLRIPISDFSKRPAPRPSMTALHVSYSLDTSVTGDDPRRAA